MHLPTSGHTPNDMVIHHAGGLHERITNRGTDEGESALLERLAHRVRLGSGRGDAVAWLQPVDDRCAAHKLPDEPVETATFLLHGKERFRVLDRAFDLQPSAHDAGVVHQLAQLWRLVVGSYWRRTRRMPFDTPRAC